MAQIVYRVSVPLGGKRVTRKFRTRPEVDAFTRGYDAKDVRVFYDARVRVGPKEISKSFKRRKDADAWAATMEHDKLRGVVIDPGRARTTFRKVAKHWEASNPAKRPTTTAVEEYALRLHILPTFGDVSLVAMTPPDIQAAVNAWTKTMAPRTVRRTYGVLRAILAYAVESDLIVRSPCRGIKLPAVVDRRRHLLDANAVSALAKAVGPRYSCAVYLGAVLGLRWSEVAGLKVGALDLTAGTVSVREVRVRTAHHDQITGPPKSEAGRRTFAIPKPLVTKLKQHLRSEGLTKDDNEAYVFTSPGGGPLDYVNWRGRVWLPACQSLGLEGVGFHDLRRTAVTALVVRGVDLKTTHTRVGHSDIRLTLQSYAQASDSADRVAANELAKHFFGTPRRSRSRDARGISRKASGKTTARKAR